MQFACDAIRNINFALDDRDKACEAFETFRKAVNRASGVAVGSRCCELDRVEQKKEFIQFLTDFSDRYAKYRARVAEVLKALKSSSRWLAVIEGRTEDIELFAEVDDYHADNGRTLKELQNAAVEAAVWGDIGVLSVRVHAAHNLSMQGYHTYDASMLRVCVSVGGRTSQTADVPKTTQPNWNSDEFLFEIGSTEWRISLEIVEKIAAGTAHVGSLSVPLEEVVKHPGTLRLRRCLDDLPNSELQLVLRYVSASESPIEEQPQSAKASLNPFRNAVAPEIPAAKVRLTDASQLWSAPCHTPSNSSKSRAESNPFKMGASLAPQSPSSAMPRTSFNGKSRASANPFLADISPTSLTSKATSSNPFKTDNSRSRAASANPFRVEKAEAATRSDESSPKRFEDLWSPRVVCAC